MIINENEQWLSGGDCEKCRKQKHCRTNCKQAKLKIESTIFNVINSKMGEIETRMKEMGVDIIPK